jgi:hypothetical protein
MYYEVFPFGKYKGVKLKELPSTYIVLALEQFSLPDELQSELFRILLGRFKVYTIIDKQIKCLNKKDCLSWTKSRISEYEMPF